MRARRTLLLGLAALVALCRRDAPSALAQAPAAPRRPETEGCAEGMVRVRGGWCPQVTQRCEHWMAEGSERCERFTAPTRCEGRRRPMDFCIDRYEYPNRAGARPEVMVTWIEATAACAAQGKRLCGENEWTFACEGEEALPYPYGYARDATACVIDHHAAAPDRRLLRYPRAQAMPEALRVNESSPSGAMPRCVSPFGVYDLTGNVDEWTVSASGRPYRSALKGGWWSQVRTRCRPVTRAHYEHFRYYQIGFRCCADPR